MHEDNVTAPKGGSIWKSFSGWLQTSKKCAKNNPNIYPQKVKMLGIVFGIFIMEIGDKVKKKSEIKPPFIYLQKKAMPDHQ